QFSSSATTFNNVCPLPWNGGTDVIMGHWDDLLMTSACTSFGGCGIYTSTSGISPNRIFNIEWRSCLYNSGNCGGDVNFEIRLYEGTSSRFDLVYGTVTNGGSGASVGVQKGTGTSLL